jgi:hypothetical protein
MNKKNDKPIQETEEPITIPTAPAYECIYPEVLAV